MSKFLITYHNGGMPSDPAQMEQVKAAFGKWLQEAGSAVIDPGAPVHNVAHVGEGQAIEVGGYTIIEADSKDEVVKILESHPFVSRGGMLQVNEVMTA